MAMNLRAIRENTYSSAYTRGNYLEKEGKVKQIQVEKQPDEPLVFVSADVKGSGANEYYTQIVYDEKDDEIVEYYCECKAYESYDGMCKHCVALALAYRAMTLQEEESQPAGQNVGAVNIFAKREREKRIWTAPALSQMIYQYSMKEKAVYFQPGTLGRVELMPILQRNYEGWSVEFKIGGESKYVLKDIREFLEAMRERRYVSYGKKLGFIHDISAFTEQSQKMIKFVEYHVKEADYIGQLGRGYYSYYAASAMRKLNLSCDAMTAFLKIMAGSKCQVSDSFSKVSEFRILEEDPMLRVKVEAKEDGFQLTLPKIETFAGTNGMAVRMGSLVYICSEDYRDHMQTFCTYAEKDTEVKLEIEEKDMNAFCSTVYPVLEKYAHVKKEVELEKFMPQKAEIKIYLDMQDGKILGKVTSTYGEKTYNVLEALETSDMYRDVEREAVTVRTMRAYFERENGKLEFELSETDEEKVYQLISTGLFQIGQMGELYVSENIKKLQIHKTSKLSVGVSLEGGLLDLTMDMDQIPYEELEGILKSYKMRKKYYRLKNGDFLQLEDGVVSTFSELVEGFSIKSKDWKDGTLKVPKYKAFYLDQVLKEEAEGLEIARNQAFKSLVRNIHSIEDSDYEVPENLKKVLRTYQKTGYRWLCTLESMGFGGILADDMGLGKTLQIITFLLAKRQGTSLIVAPASLVYNWESEIQRFAPELKILVMTGAAAERAEKLETYQEYDVVVTSYDLLKRDLELYEGKRFYAEIIDEAQNIKNQTTQSAKAVKQMEAQVKFALTGTPIENRLSELWSIFDYLMPGLLGSYEYFRKEYEYPIVQGKDEIVTTRLQRMIKPFVLRRLKGDVLKDLPDKIENVVYSKLEGKQEELYQANVQEMILSLQNSSAQEVQSEKLQILAKLTRIRQICCDPSLIYEDYKEGSAKLDTCMELIENAVESGHKVLLFSQFTSMLAVIEAALKKKKIKNYILTGSTTKEKRKELVEAFNKDDVPVFLISLKAGGTGLNLTAATIVIHFDPWWNMAAQNQATDRAHRIGQKEVVTVFKLIAKNTIEEKILKLQEEKRELSDQIISGEGIQVSALTKEDFMGLLESQKENEEL